MPWPRHYEPERFRPIDRNKHRHGTAEKILFLALIHLADKFDAVAVDEGLDLLLEIMGLHARYFGRNAQRQARLLREPDRDMRALFRREAAQKRQIAAALQIRRQKLLGKPVVDRVDPIEVRQRRALIVGDRDKRRVRKAGNERRLIAECRAGHAVS